MAAFMRVTYVDGREVVIRVGPKSLVACERHFQVSMLDFGRTRTIEQFYWPAWHALHEAGKEAREFDDWLGDLDSLKNETDTPDNPVGDEAVNPEPDPTQRAQPSGT